MKEIKPFPDATNKTAVTIFKKQYRKKTKYPVAYNIWNAKAEKTRAIPVASTLKSVFERIECTQMEANPVTARNSPWAILPKGRFREIQYLAGKCDWVQGRKGITADLNGIYFVNILEVNDSNGLVKIRTRPEAGRINIGPAKEHWVEADLLFPLVKGASDFQRCFFSRDHELFAFVPNDGIIKSAYDAARTKLDQLNYSSAYFKAYKKVLSDRSTLKGRMKNAPFFAIYNVGHYTFARWKVIWAEQKDFCAAVVSSHEVPLIGNRPFVPDHKVFFVEFTKEKPAYYLCGLLNSEIVIEFVKSHNISIQIGDVFKHMNLPDFDLANHDHISLANLAKRCHKENNIAKRDVILKEISKLSHKIITSPNI